MKKKYIRKPCPECNYYFVVQKDYKTWSCDRCKKTGEIKDLNKDIFIK